MSIEMRSNLESVSSILGTYKGMSDAMESDRFLQMLISRAHGKALDAFDIAAAARAMKTRNLRNSSISHMYEYGVPGITPGQPTITDPTSSFARLWVYLNTPGRTGVDTTIIFRQATIPNPAATDNPKLKHIDRSELQKLTKTNARKYVFRERARILEYGVATNPKPIAGGALFIPHKNAGNGKGFIFGTAADASSYGRSESNDKTTGNFRTFFWQWWNGNAAEIVHQHSHQTLTGKIGAIRSAMKDDKTLKKARDTRARRRFEKEEKAARDRMMRL